MVALEWERSSARARVSFWMPFRCWVCVCVDTVTVFFFFFLVSIHFEFANILIFLLCFVPVDGANKKKGTWLRARARTLAHHSIVWNDAVVFVCARDDRRLLINWVFDQNSTHFLNEPVRCPGRCAHMCVCVCGVWSAEQHKWFECHSHTDGTPLWVCVAWRQSQWIYKNNVEWWW